MNFRFDRRLLKEDISDYEIDKVYKKLSKLNNVDFGALEDEYLKTRPSLKDAVYKFYGTILNTKSYCKDFVKWAKEEKGIDLKGLPCKESLQRRIKEGWLDTPDALKKCKPNEVLDALQYFYGEDVVRDLRDTKKYTDEEKLKALKYYFKKHPQNESVKRNIKEDFRAQIDWRRLKHELWDVLEKKSGAHAYVDFEEFRTAFSSNQSGVEYYVIWGDEDAGEELTTTAGKMFGTPSKITVTMHHPNQSGTDEVDVYNVDEMAKALLNF